MKKTWREKRWDRKFKQTCIFVNETINASASYNAAPEDLVPLINTGNSREEVIHVLKDKNLPAFPKDIGDFV